MGPGEGHLQCCPPCGPQGSEHSSGDALPRRAELESKATHETSLAVPSRVSNPASAMTKFRGWENTFISSLETHHPTSLRKLSTLTESMGIFYKSRVFLSCKISSLLLSFCHIKIDSVLKGSGHCMLFFLEFVWLP